MTLPFRVRHVVILGGGLTGAAFALHLIRTSVDPLKLTIVEPADELGRGIAYSATALVHRINVPSDRMGLFPDEPDHFTRWLVATGALPDPDSTDARGHHYVPRRLYGTYVGAALTAVAADAAARLRFAHIRAAARAVARHGDALQVVLDAGPALVADEVVLASGHARPAPPDCVDAAVRGNPKLVLDPWAPGAYDVLAPQDRVLVVGTGLTMADVVASLEARGHAGAVVAVSRHGLLSRSHGLFVSGIDILEGAAPPRTALGLLRLLRGRIRADRGEVGWAALADALRFKLPALWGALPVAEKRKALHRLLPFWEVHRFRIAPFAHAAIERMRTAGRLSVERAALLGVERAGDRLAAALRRPGGAVASDLFDAVVLCTGPGKDLGANPLVRSLIENGLARPDAIGLGLDVDARSRLVNRDGIPQPDLLALGPLTRGTFGEMTGAPDIIRHIVAILAGRAAARRQARGVVGAARP